MCSYTVPRTPPSPGNWQQYSTKAQSHRFSTDILFSFFLNLTMSRTESRSLSMWLWGFISFAILITTRRSAEQYLLYSSIYYCVAHQSAAIESRLNLALNCTVKCFFFSLFSAIDIDCHLLRTRESYRSCLAWIYFFNSSGWLLVLSFPVRLCRNRTRLVYH